MKTVLYSALFMLVALMSSSPMAGNTVEPQPAASAADARSELVGRPDWPLPEDAPDLLFFIQRSMNPNTVVYEAGLLPDGRLDPSRPVIVYWRRYNNEGERRDLSILERTIAFGVNHQPLQGDISAYRISSVSYAEKSAKVYINGDGRAVAVTDIDGHPAVLVSVFVQLDGDGIIPDVVHIDIFGRDLETGERRHERILND